MTDVDIYQPPAGQLEQYQARLVMTPEAAKALDDQLTQCIRAILHEGTDYGVIPGTGGDKSLWRPGAQKLLLWFGLGFTCDRVETDADADGQRLGVTYRCTVFRQTAHDHRIIVTTCEGYAGYDEDKFYQSAEQVQDKAEAKERMWAAKDRRVANPTKWKGDPDRGIPAPGEYRAPWNSVIKRAQKRAIVGATLDATAAGGRFNQEREEDDHAPVPQNDGAAWYEQAIELALASTETEPGGELQTLFVGAAQAHKDGLINRRQQDHVQNTVRQRLALLKKAAVVVEAEDLGRQAQEDEPDPTTSGASSSADAPASGSPQETAAPSPSSPAGSASTPEPPDSDRHRNLVGAVQGHFKRLGFSDDDKAERLWAAAKLAGTSEIASLNDLDPDELGTVADALAKCRDRAKLEAMLATGETSG